MTQEIGPSGFSASVVENSATQTSYEIMKNPTTGPYLLLLGAKPSLKFESQWQQLFARVLKIGTTVHIQGTAAWIDDRIS